MNKLLNKAKTTITSTDLSTVVDDIMNIAKLLTNPGTVTVIIINFFE